MDLRGFVKSYVDETYPLSGEFAWQRLPGDGSKRAFYRLSAEQGSFIVMEYPPWEMAAEKENLSYLRIGEHLLGKGIPVARIFRYDLDHGWFIMEDLGQTNLQEIALGSENRIDIYKRVLELLVKLQIEGREDFNPQWCFHTKRYDRFVMERHESEYFLTYFVQGFLGMDWDLTALTGPFTHLSYKASLADNNFFLHRDFQSRNLIVHGDKIGIVDWQGGRIGPLQYDLASLLIDPYVRLASDERILLYDYYLTLVERRLPGALKSFSRHYPYLAIQRNLQILGAFSYLGNVQGKSRFLDYISPALESLVGLLEECDDPELHQLKMLVKEINERPIEPHSHRKSDTHTQEEKGNGKEYRL
jgi:aminoglycoside/choline kinase family phosphotransferase